jgi:hypothetical protein
MIDILCVWIIDCTVLYIISTPSTTRVQLRSTPSAHNLNVLKRAQYKSSILACQPDRSYIRVYM